jgi:penicillin-binding protein 2
VEAAPAHWDAVLESMRAVVHSPRGTARKIGEGMRYEMASKTGTSQVIGIAQGAIYVEADVAERHRNHGLFIAFAPYEAPTIAVAVIVENGGGASAASPIARAVLDAWLLADDEVIDG